MRIVFWGTPDFAVPSLRALDDEGFEVVGVITQPDRPKGRGRRMAASPVKEVATAAGFPVLTPDVPRGEEFLAEFRALEPDLSIVVAYGHILRPEVLDLPRLGSINVHASVLPELRGAAPINWAIARGFERTGVTVMRMAEGMDSGAILHVIEEPILPDETASELTVRLSELGAEALVEALALLGSGRLREEEQDHDLATFAPKVDRAAARIDWDRPAREIGWHVRGMDAVPGAWSELDGQPVKLYRPHAVADRDVPSSAEGALPGTVVAADEELGLLVAAAEGVLALLEVQPPGRKRMPSRDWIRGRGVVVGQQFS